MVTGSRREVDPVGHGLEPVVPVVGAPSASPRGERVRDVRSHARRLHRPRWRGVSRRRAGAPAPGRGLSTAPDPCRSASLHSMRARATIRSACGRPDEGLGRPARRRSRTATRRREHRRRPPSRRPASTSTRRRPAPTATATRRTRATTPTRTSTPGRASRRSSASSGPAPSGPPSGSPSAAAGWPVHAVASRDAGRRERFRSLVDGTRAFADPAADPRRGRADHPGRPGRRHRARWPRSLRMYSGQAHGPHERRARCRGPRAGDGRRDPDRLVPSARRVRRHRAGGRRAPRRDRRDRGRRPAGGAAGRDGRGDRRARPSASRRARRRPITRPRSSPPAASSRCSTRSPSWAGWPASTRPARWRSTGRSSRGTLGNARALGIRAALTGPIDPRRRRDARRPPRRRSGRTPRACSTCIAPPRGARSTWPRPVAP